MTAGVKADFIAPEIPGFTVKEHIGTGGFAKVYLAMEDASCRAFALKIPRSDHAPEQTAVKRFHREATRSRGVAAGSLVARVHSYDLASKPPWLATAFIPGPSVDEAAQAAGLATGNGFPAEFTWALAALLIEAVSAIHAAGILHRDIKPANVLLDRSGPTIIDLGLMGILDDTGSAITSNHDRIGTVAYCAPEQLVRLSDARRPADVYALAATLYFAATGRAPHPGGAIEVLAAHQARRRPDPEGLNVQLWRFLAPCFANDPAERPTLAQLAERLPAGARGWYRESVPDSVKRDHDRFLALLEKHKLTEHTREFGPEPPTQVLNSPKFVPLSPTKVLTPEYPPSNDGATQPYSMDAEEATAEGPRPEVQSEEAPLVLRLHPIGPVVPVAEVAHGEVQARRGRVLQAAARVLGSAPEISPARLSRLARSAGVDDLDDAEADTALKIAQDAAMEVPDWDAGLEDLLSRVVEGGLRGATVAEITASGLVVRHLTGSAAGGVRESVTTMPWFERIAPGPEPSPDLELLTLVLAGEPRDVPQTLVPAGNPLDGARLVRRMIQRALMQLSTGGLPDAPFVLVHRHPGWPLLDTVADALRSHRVPSVDAALHLGRSIADVVGSVLRRLPTAWPLALVTAQVDVGTGEVTAHPVTLFDDGVRPGTAGAVATRTLCVPATTGEPLLLPIVAMRSPNPRDWETVAVWLLEPLPAGSQVDLVVTLTARNRVAVAVPGRPPNAVVNTATTWSEVRGRLPARATRIQRGGVPHVDVAVAIELGASDEDIGPRLRFLNELVAAAAESGDTRVAIVGYGDHLLDPTAPPKRPRWEVEPPDVRRDHDPELFVHPFAAPRSAAANALGLRASLVEHDLAAPLEEALNALTKRGVGWRAGARHALVIIGSRPPHPPDRDDVYVLHCPYKVDAEDALNRLRAIAGVQAAAVLEPLDAHLREGRSISYEAVPKAEAMWAAFLPERRLPLAGADAREVLRSLGAWAPGQDLEEAVPIPFLLHRSDRGRPATV